MHVPLALNDKSLGTSLFAGSTIWETYQPGTRIWKFIDHMNFDFYFVSVV